MTFSASIACLLTQLGSEEERYARGVVSHAGSALLRELAAETGLAGAVTGALIDTYRGSPLHLPGQVFADLAVAIVDGADAVTGIEVQRDRER